MKTIKLKISATLILGIVLQVQSAISQEIKADPVARAEMVKLNFMTGDWQGDGWMMGRDREKHSFLQTENIKYKLDSSLIVIEGRGNSDGKVIHDALAVITFNKEKGHYDFRSYLRDGRTGVYKAELIDDKLYWYPNDNLRYIINTNAKGQWYEVGEINKDGTWYQFFEMTLDKK